MGGADVARPRSAAIAANIACCSPFAVQIWDIPAPDGMGGEQHAMVEKDPFRLPIDHAALGAFVPDRRRSLERKLSEFGGYALLLLTLAMLAMALFYVMR